MSRIDIETYLKRTRLLSEKRQVEKMNPNEFLERISPQMANILAAEAGFSNEQIQAQGEYKKKEILERIEKELRL